ncbi:MAG: 2-C-methyl-D-erythritol 4-phosphate cytidylyltransferase [Bacteroidales bacterium]
MQLYALIVAGGTGKRLGSTVPKQFLELAGKPILMHTLERFAGYNDSIEIIVVLPAGYIAHWSELCNRHSSGVPHKVVPGGSLRFFSVLNGLDLIPDEGLVAIHDGVRPLVSKETIRRCFEAAGISGNAIPALIPADSLRLMTDDSSQPVSRNRVRLIQTPQVFRADLIKKAYLQGYHADFTDDATVLERSGEKIHIVDGNRENIKITNPEDLAIAESLLRFIS